MDRHGSTLINMPCLRWSGVSLMEPTYRMLNGIMIVRCKGDRGSGQRPVSDKDLKGRRRPLGVLDTIVHHV